MNKKEIEEQVKRVSEISERFGVNCNDFCGYPCVAAAWEALNGAGATTREKQIEEMANIPHKCIKSSCEDCIKNDRKCPDCKQAEALYNAGYQKVPDGAVIISPEERDEEMKAYNEERAEWGKRIEKLNFQLVEYANENLKLKAKKRKLLKASEDFSIKHCYMKCEIAKTLVKEFAEKLKTKAHKGAAYDVVTYKFIERDYTITESEFNELLKEYEK